MNADEVVRVRLIDGRPYEAKPDGSLVPLPDRSDHGRLDRQDDDEIVLRGEDAPMSDEEWALAETRRPVKVPVGLKLDDDVLAYFKARGRGYQSRINAVLRSYIDARRNAGRTP